MADETVKCPGDWSESECSEILSIAAYTQAKKKAGKKIVFVTGVFDLLHQEHKIFLEKAHNLGDVLIVGLESDVRVRAMKGPERPIQSQSIRRDSVSTLNFVDLAFILPQAFYLPDHHRALIRALKPDFLAVSSHSPHQGKKQQILNEFGGTLQIVHEHNPDVSTTKQISSAQNAQK